MSDSLWLHGLQHVRLLCPPLSPRVCSNSCPLSWWCHPTISSSVTPFSSCPQSFPASGSFLVIWPFASGGQSIGASASALPVNIQGWFLFRIDCFDLLAVQGTLRILLRHHKLVALILRRSAFFTVQFPQSSNFSKEGRGAENGVKNWSCLHERSLYTIRGTL